MNLDRLTPAIALCSGALVVSTVAWLAPMRPDKPSLERDDEVWETAVLLAKLEAECSPDSVANDYTWSTSAPPTERHRREMLERLHAMRDTALEEVQARLGHSREDEFGEMLVVIAAGLGDEPMLLRAAKLMAYSEHPAVRLSAARELRMLRDPRTVEWFEYAAQNDDRLVRNDNCGRTPEFFYPVRTTAQLALKDMGIEFKSDEEDGSSEKQALAEERLKPTPPPPPSAPEAGNLPQTR